MTVDQNIEYQQNLVNLPLPVVIIETRSTDIDVLAERLPGVLAALGTIHDRAAAGGPAGILVRVGAGGVIEA